MWRSSVSFTASSLLISSFPTVHVYTYTCPPIDSAFARPVQGASYRTYLDERANRPYYIYRVSGVELVRRWRRAAQAACASSSNYQGILQGFFAGEGNIHESKSYHSRVLRIAQGERFPLLERILRYFRVKLRYVASGMSYEISGRDNLEKLWNLGISKLHSDKHARFAVMIASYKQHHYERLSLFPKILESLESPMTARELASLMSRSKSRMNQALTSVAPRG